MKEWTPTYIRLRLTDVHQIKANVNAGSTLNYTIEKNILLQVS